MRLSNVPGTDDSWTHGNLQFFYGNEAVESASNNGNVVRADSWAQKTDGSGAWTAQYDRYYYDGLNRLYKLYESGNHSANTTDTFQFQQQFTFDRWGNRSIDLANTMASVPDDCCPLSDTNAYSHNLLLPFFKIWGCLD